MTQASRSGQRTPATFTRHRSERWRAHTLSYKSFVLAGLLVCLLGTAPSAAAARNRHVQQAAGSRRLLEQYETDYSSDWWRVLPTTSIDRHDIDCGQNNSFIHASGQVVNFCRVCGGPEAVADECALREECAGFVMDNVKDAGRCGYLKSAVLKQARKEVPSETLFCKGSEPDCADARYVYMPRRDIKDTGDFPCGYRDPEFGNAEQPFCFIPGDLNAVALKCDRHQNCKAFVSGTRAGIAGGYFKTKRGPVTSSADTSVYLWLRKQAPPEPEPQSAVTAPSPSPSPSPLPAVASPSPSLSPSPAPEGARIAEPWGACGPQHNARCPGSQCCSSSNHTCGENNFCSITEGGCLSAWGFCDTPGTQRQDGGNKSPWNVNVIAGVASAGAVTLGALLGAMFTAWKWHHKRQAVKAKGELPTSARPLTPVKPGNPVVGHPVAAQPVRPAPHRVIHPN